MPNLTERAAGPVAHTDGGCNPNPGPGGWGVHVEYPDGRVVELGGSELHTTNNRMELRAAIEAVRATVGWPTATIVTDSQYVRKGITGWVAGWKRKDWITSTGEPVLNRDLWEELDSLADRRLTWEWTRGHSGDPGNERCDEIAGYFSSTVARLRERGGAQKSGARGDGPAPTRTPRDEQPTGHGHTPPALQASKPARPVPSHTPTTPGPAPSIPQPAWPAYLSLVDGVLARHLTWGACEQRVHGARGARYKKVRNPGEERDTLATWGLTEADLFGIQTVDDVGV